MQQRRWTTIRGQDATRERGGTQSMPTKYGHDRVRRSAWFAARRASSNERDRVIGRAHEGKRVAMDSDAIAYTVVTQ